MVSTILFPHWVFFFSIQIVLYWFLNGTSLFQADFTMDEDLFAVFDDKSSVKTDDAKKSAKTKQEPTGEE